MFGCLLLFIGAFGLGAAWGTLVDFMRLPPTTSAILAFGGGMIIGILWATFVISMGWLDEWLNS